MIEKVTKELQIQIVEEEATPLLVEDISNEVKQQQEKKQ